MDKFFILHKEAEEELKRTDHMLYVSLDLIENNKVVEQILTHISNAAFTTLESLLEFTWKQQKIKPFPRNRKVMLKIYSENPDIGLDPKFLIYLRDLNKIMEHISESLIKFKKGDEFTFSTSDHTSKTISKSKIKEYHSSTENFVNKVGDLIYG